MARPNILIIYTDQQRWDALGANGNHEIKTPNLDRLAADGVCFDHCQVQNPVCMPSRISMLSGRYPSSLGITHMGVPVPEETLVLPGMVSGYGYHTANIGKLHFLPHACRDHRQVHPGYGFDQLEISDEPGVYEDAYRAWVRRVAPEQLDHLSVGLPPATAVWYRTMGLHDTVKHPAEGGRFDTKGARAFPGDEGYTHSAFVGKRTIEYLRDRPANQPFCCIAGFYSPHSPWVAPQRYLDRYDPAALSLPVFPPEVEARRQADEQFSDETLRSARQGYYAMVTEVDHWVGEILRVLDQRELTDNTIVVFTSDHGEWLGEHLKYGKGYPAHDMVSRVPLLVRWPAALGRPGRRVGSLVESVDIVPTLLEAAGLPTPPQVQGRSLWGLLRGDDQPVRDSALMEHAGWKMLRTEAFRYIVRASGEEHLWDLTAELGEYRDVVDDLSYGAALTDCRRRLLQRVVAQEQPLERIWPY